LGGIVNGHLGTPTSSARFKEGIKPIDKASEAILALQPVTFRYKHELDPDEAVNAMLLNEFLKEHRKVQDQEKTIAELKSGMETFSATVKEQAAQIQKVSDKLEVSKAARQLVADSH
jgi:hypothetical protein